MTPLETCIAAIDACERTPDAIEAALDVLKPHLEPYFEEDGFDVRFAKGFRASMKMPIPGMKDRAKEVVTNLLEGPTHAEQQEKIQAQRAAQEAEVRKAIEEGEKQFISALLANLGFRKGDKIPVHRGAGVHTISLEGWDLPEVEPEEPTPDIEDEPDVD